ncbi:tetratricopeptide repeat protein, partial [bacterium]
TMEVLLVDGTKLVAAKDGDKLTGERTFRVRVQANDPISSVEFYVGDDLRDTDGSTPYEFKFDALNEEEGTVKLTFKGYTAKGTSATKVLRLVVDNGGGVSVEDHLKRGREALSNGNSDGAIDAGRTALKVDPNNQPARLLLARAYLAKNQYDRAQKFADDALAADGTNQEALEIQAGIGVQRAFVVTSSGGDRAETLRAYGEALGSAAQAQSKVNEARFTGLAPDLATTNPTGYADAAFRAGRYTAAVATLKPAYDKDTTNTALGNRLAYGYLLAGDPKAASDTLGSIRRYGKYDAYTYALQGLILGQQGNDDGADEAFKNGALENADSLGLRTAQASLQQVLATAQPHEL